MKQEYRKLASVESRVLYDLKIEATQCAYWYFLTTLELLSENPMMMIGTHKQLFAEVAKIHDTSVASVESAMRRAIQQSWDKRLIPLPKRPTPGQFLSFLMMQLVEREEMSK